MRFSLTVVGNVKLDATGWETTLTFTVIRLIQFVLGGGVQVQTDRPVLSRDKVKGRPVQCGLGLQIITMHES